MSSGLKFMGKDPGDNAKPVKVKDDGTVYMAITENLINVSKNIDTLHAGDTEVIEIKPPEGKIWFIQQVNLQIRLESNKPEASIDIRFSRGVNLVTRRFLQLVNEDNTNEIRWRGIGLTHGKVVAPDEFFTTMQLTDYIQMMGVMSYQQPLFVEIRNTSDVSTNVENLSLLILERG